MRSVRSLALALLVGSGGCLGLAAEALAGPYRPPLPASRPKKYDPDATTCQPEQISDGFARQLRPYADQPAPVLARLKLVQGEMTRATLRRCVAQGRMTREQATALALKLGVISSAN